MKTEINQPFVSPRGEKLCSYVLMAGLLVTRMAGAWLMYPPTVAEPLGLIVLTGVTSSNSIKATPPAIICIFAQITTLSSIFAFSWSTGAVCSFCSFCRVRILLHAMLPIDLSSPDSCLTCSLVRSVANSASVSSTAALLGDKANYCIVDVASWSSC